MIWFVNIGNIWEWYFYLINFKIIKLKIVISIIKKISLYVKWVKSKV